MKKLKRISAIALTSVVGATTLLAGQSAPINNVYAGTMADSTIVVSNLENAYSLDNAGYIYVPCAKNSSGDYVETKICPLYSSEEVVDLDTADKSTIKFKPSYSTYVVTYKNGSVEKSFTINVELEDVKLGFVENDSVLLPSTTVVDKAITLPDLSVVDSDNKEIENAMNFVTIKITNVDGTVITENTESATLVGKVFTPKKSGTYNVVYTFNSDYSCAGYDTLSKAYKVEVYNANDAGFKSERKITLSLNSSFGKPVIGSEFKLPEVTAKDNTNNIDNIEKKTIVAVKYEKDGSFHDVTMTGNYTFIPEIEADYIVSYQVKDFFGNESEVYNYRLADVVDNTNPDYVLVDTYDADTLAENFELKDFEDYSYIIPSIIKEGIGAKIVIPAIIAKDNVTSLNDLTITRKIQKTSLSTTYNIDQDFDEAVEIVYNDSTSKFEYTNKAGEVKSLSWGSWKVTYTIIDKKDNKREVSFTFVIKEATDASYSDVTAPKVTFDKAIPTKAVKGQTITFNKPSVVDYYLDEDGDEITGDTRIQTKIYWFYNDKIDCIGNPSYLLKPNENGKYSIDVPTNQIDGVDVTKISIYVEAIDDNGNKTAIDDAKHEIRVVGVTTIDPVLVSVGSFASGIKQGDNVALPTVIVENNDENGLSIKYEVVSSNGNKMSVNQNTLISTISGGNKEFSGATFYASQSGDYKVTITVTNSNNNALIYFTNLNDVEKTIQPSISLNEDDVTIEFGETYDLKMFTLWVDGQIANANDVVVSDANGYVNLSDYTFKPLTLSTTGFEVKFVYDKGGEYCEKTMRIRVVDTTKPKLEFDSNIYSAAYTKNNAINVVAPKALSDNYSDYESLSSSLTVKVTYNNAEQTLTASTDENVLYTFTPANDGIYTIEYSVADANGNVTTKSYDVVVGDRTAPTISLGDESKNAPTTMTVGSTIDLDLSLISIFDDVDGSMSVKDKLLIEIKGPNDSSYKEVKALGSSKIEKSNLKLNTIGSYTLRYKVTDANGNDRIVTKSITVSEKEVESKNVEDVGMVIAIIASLAFLAAAIIYFFKPDKKKDVTRRKRNRK